MFPHFVGEETEARTCGSGPAPGLRSQAPSLSRCLGIYHIGKQLDSVLRPKTPRVPRGEAVCLVQTRRQGQRGVSGIVPGWVRASLHPNAAVSPSERRPQRPLHTYRPPSGQLPSLLQGQGPGAPARVLWGPPCLW